MGQVEKVLAASALALLVATPSAQTRPDFSGRWTVVPEASAAGGGRGGPGPAATMGSGWGAEITITQDAVSLAMERALFSPYDMQPPVRFVYALDGSESRNVVNMGRGPQETISKVTWQDAALVLTTRHHFNNPQNGEAMTSEVSQVLSLDAPGSLVVVTTRTAVLGGPSSTTRTTYKKG